LLQSLAACQRIKSPHKTAWRNTSWTQLDESSYYGLIGQLREVVPPNLPFWMLEEHWNATDDEQ
jgi:hypothetical protein